MSRTIITNSGSQFFTNISAEQVIGRLCKSVGAPYHEDKFFNYSDEEKAMDLNISMAYKMTKKEAKNTAVKLKTLLDNHETFERYKRYFHSTATIETFNDFILVTIEDFDNSNGYKCG